MNSQGLAAVATILWITEHYKCCHDGDPAVLEKEKGKIG
jgi:hypothetical protein